MLRCPGCSAGYRMTWPRYLKSWERRACDGCGTPVKVRKNAKYWGTLAIASCGLVLGVLAVALTTTIAMHGGNVYEAWARTLDSGWLLPGLVVLLVLGLVIDRVLETRYGELVVAERTAKERS